METYKRRQLILSLLKQSGELEVDELAARLGVSPNTIRNDFNALALTGALQRVRGGAALPAAAGIGGPPSTTSQAFLSRWMIRQEAKRNMARWAAELVEDGDSVLLDASSTVFFMAEFLQKRSNLTVVTNGIEVARALATNPTNTVMLLGGLMRADGILVGGIQSDQILQDLHVGIAFISCAGFTPQVGLTETNLQEAQLKKQMVPAANQVVALIDSSKFGRTDLVPFAGAGQLTRVFTDGDLSAVWVERMRQACVDLTICDWHGAANLAPCRQEARHYVIGFANLHEQMPFAVEVRRGLERVAKDAGNIDLIVADNQLDEDVALQVADRLIAAHPDLVIEYQLHEHLNTLLMEKFRHAGVPVIAVDIPIIGATYFGADNYRAGHMAGLALGEWIKQHWDGRFDRLFILEEPRAGAIPAARIQGQLDGLREILGPIDPARTVRLNSGNVGDVSEASVSSALAALPHEHRIAVLPFNDDAALGALAAARRQEREADLALVGHGADRTVRDEMQKPGSRIIGSTCYYPERYGEALIALALKILRGEPVPPAVYIEHTFIHSPLAQRNAVKEELHETSRIPA